MVISSVEFKTMFPSVSSGLIQPVNSVVAPQDFEYFVVIDFEATCDDKGKLPPYPQEIIEFPSVLVSGTTGQLVGSFQTYVRPTSNPMLTDFCKDLTGIHQTQVDRGVSLSQALVSHDQWLENKGIKNTNFAVVTWSDWDCKVMLESECRHKNITKPPYFNRWINLQVPFGKVFGMGRCKLKHAVEMAGLAWEGRAHCGLDDAKNTARLVALIMHKGFKLSITNYQKPNTVQTQLLPASSYSSSCSITPSCYCIPSCYCGLKSRLGVIMIMKRGDLFYQCGRSPSTSAAAATAPRCLFFQWVIPRFNLKYIIANLNICSNNA